GVMVTLRFLATSSASSRCDRPEKSIRFFFGVPDFGLMITSLQDCRSLVALARRVHAARPPPQGSPDVSGPPSLRYCVADSPTPPTRPGARRDERWYPHRCRRHHQL